MKYWTLAFILLVTGLCASCKGGGDYSAALNDCKRVLIIPEQFDACFGALNVDHAITSFSGGETGRFKFWSEAHVRGRYRVGYEAWVKLAGDRVVSKEVGRVQINEVVEIIDHGDGQFEAVYGTQIVLTEDDWSKVALGEYDFRRVNVIFKEGAPVKNFDAYVNAVRSVRK